MVRVTNGMLQTTTPERGGIFRNAMQDYVSRIGMFAFPHVVLDDVRPSLDSGLLQVHFLYEYRIVLYPFDSHLSQSAKSLCQRKASV